MVQAASTTVMDRRLHLVRASFDELSKIATFNGDPGVSVALEKHSQALTDAAMGTFHFLEACEEVFTKEAEARAALKTKLANALRAELKDATELRDLTSARVEGFLDELEKNREMTVTKFISAIVLPSILSVIHI